MKQGRSISFIIRLFFLILLGIIAVLPVLYTFANSFMSSEEITLYYGPAMMEDGQGFSVFHLIPDELSLDGYRQILLEQPEYLLKFWNSVALAGSIVLGQVAISCLGGYGFSKFCFPLKNTIFVIVMIVMMMPYQVTLVSNYIVLKEANLIGSFWSVILPGIFSPFGVFLMKQAMDGVPDEMIESAQLDGARQLTLLRRVVIPCAKGGLVALILLSFIDNWNMVEQPLVFLKDQSQYPLSVFLAQVNRLNFSVSFACGVLAMIPVFLLFGYFEEELVEGIALSGLK
ncbi:MAG: carbohydrate ABC transporter permease [Massiliimalia sp.]|jgi:multiple sugar transport system permease protein